MSKHSHSSRDNRANQLNPQHSAFHQSRGASPGAAKEQAANDKPAVDNRANQLNPNNPAHGASRSEGQRGGEGTSSTSTSKKSE